MSLLAVGNMIHNAISVAVSCLLRRNGLENQGFVLCNTYLRDTGEKLQTASYIIETWY